MKKLLLLTKTLLAAALLCVGQNAWGDPTTAFSADFTDKSSTNPSDYGFNVTYGSGSGSSLVNFSVTGGVLQCVAGPYANKNDGNRTGTATATFSSIGVRNEVTVSYVWALGNATGNATGSYTKTRIGNSSGNALELSFFGTDNNGTLKVNGTTVKTGNSSIRNTTYTVNATLNMNTQKITALTLTCSNSTFSYTASDAIDFASAITSVDRFAFENSERQNWGNTSSIDNVNITYVEALEPVESFVLNYTYNAEVIASEDISTDGLYCGDTYESLPYRKYIVKNGVLYETTANTGANDYYHQKNISLVKNTVVNKSLSLVNLNGGTIVFFKDFDGATGNNAGIRASYGSSYDNTQFTSEEDLPAGKYTFMTRAYSRSRGSSVKVGDQEVFKIADVGGSWQDKTFTDVNVPAAGKLALVKGASSTDPVDIIIAILHSVPATITSAGYATFSSKYDLDFTTPVAGLTAYKAASATSSTVTLEEVTGKVKAGDGLVIKGTAGTYSIPVTTGASTIYTTPEIITMWGYNGNETETVSKAGSGTNFVLSVQDEKVVFAPINGTNATLNPGQAALWTASTPEARALRISFDDITGVANVEAADEAKAKEGKFIENGKLVIVKNGQKFNAAGAKLY